MVASSPDRHFEELDGMRGVLASVVMFHHLGLNTLMAQATAGLLHHGKWELCVDFFFMLSGFVLCQSFIRRPLTFARYAEKRLLRLAPMFLLTTLAALWLTGAAQWSLAVVAGNILMLQPFLGQPSINMVSWSIPYELVFPAALVVAVVPAQRLQRRGVLGLLLAAMAVQAFATWLLAAHADWQHLRAAAGLAAGALLFLARRAAPPSAPPKAPAAVALAFFAGCLTVMAVTGVAPWAGAAFPALAAGAIWYGAQARGLFSTAPFRALGRWSYSIYLLHIPVLLGAAALIGPGRIDGAPLVKLGLAAATIALAAFCFRYIERPMMGLARPPRPVTATPTQPA